MTDLTTHPDAADRILQLLKDEFKEKINSFFNGDPEAIGESQLPAVTVTAVDADIDLGATQTDEIKETIVIRFIFNKKDDLGATPDTDTTEYRLRKMIAGQDLERKYLPGTLMYALRTHITLGDIAVGNRIRWDLTDVLRPDDVVTKEAIVTLDIERMAIIPTRD